MVSPGCLIGFGAVTNEQWDFISSYDFLETGGRKVIKVLRKIISAFAGIFGIDIVLARKRHNTDFVFVDRNAVEAFFDKDEYVKLYYEGLYKTGMGDTDNYFKQCRSYRLQQMLEHVLKAGLVGNVAECGCWRGHSSYIISTILARNMFAGKFNIFDSFEGGLSDKDDQDSNARVNLSEKEIAQEKQNFASTEMDLHQALKDFEFYKLYRGWIPEKFNEVEDEQFIFVHIDVDLYQPILDSLEFFYPRMKKGGVIILDDYGYTQFPGAKTSVDEFLARNSYSMYLAELTGGSILIK